MKKLLANFTFFTAFAILAIDDLGMTAELFRDAENFDWLFSQKKATK